MVFGRVVVALAAVLLAASGSRVKLSDNVYRGLVVGIDDKVDALRCREVIGNVQTLLNAASSHLYEATNQRACFGDVTVVIPRSWPDSCTGDDPPGQTSTASYLTSDLRVSTPHPVYGTDPWTHQTGLCGQPGAFIQLPAGYVASVNNKTYERKARVLVHEWARYRWGVFEEAGYPGDRLYPSFHQRSAGQWRPTDCADGTVAGVVSPSGCVPSSNTCTFEPFTNASNAGITSSLMSLRHLDQVRKFCDDWNHDRSAPTKHNLLCGERSVWKVMQDHPDFRNGSNPPNSNATAPPVKVRVVKVAPERFFFLLESTATMRHHERWDFVSNSIRKFVNWDAPTGVQVGIGHFGSAYRTDRNLTTVPASLMGRGELANLPPIADDVAEDKKSWRSAVDGALAALGARAAGATLVWVTGNERNSTHQPTPDDQEYLIRTLRQKQTRLVVIFYPYVTPGLSKVATESGGTTVVVEDLTLGGHTSISVFHALTDAYVFVLHKFISDKRRLMVRVEDKEFVGGGQKVRGSFLIDSSVGVNTTLTVLYRSRSDIGYVKLKRPGGEMAPVYTYPDTTNHLQYAKVDPVHGLWEYEVDSLASSAGSVVVQVTSESARDEQGVRAEAWTNADRSGTLDAAGGPLIVYASVMRGQSPILDAEVHAVITRPDGQRVRLKLLDNGLGVPDVLHGDGVYSRYFTDFGSVTAASQPFRIRVEVGGSRARVATGRDPGRRAAPRSCCGSSVGHVKSSPVPDLRRSVSAGGVFVSGAAGLRTDLYPPSRVTDLRAEVDPVGRTVTFTWTAPGDDFDSSSGMVRRYEARYSDTRSQLPDNFTGCALVPRWGQPEPAGTASRTVVAFNVSSALLFFAIRGEDDAGNVAPISNIVPLLMPPPPPPPPPPPAADTTAPPAPRSAALGGRLLLISLASAAGVALLLLLLLGLYCGLRRRRRKAPPDTAAAVEKDAGVRQPSPITIDFHPEKEKAASVSTASAGQTPIMWTASDILEPHVPRPAADDSLGRCGGRARYNSYRTPYVEDVAWDGRSLGSSQPSESLASVSSEARPGAASADGERAGWTGGCDSPGAASPPPGLPPAMVMLPLDRAVAERRSAVLAFVERRKRRTVTQV